MRKVKQIRQKSRVRCSKQVKVVVEKLRSESAHEVLEAHVAAYICMGVIVIMTTPTFAFVNESKAVIERIPVGVAPTD